MKVNFLYEAVEARKELIFFQLLKGKKKLPTGNAVLIETILQECIGKRHPQMKAN